VANQTETTITLTDTPDDDERAVITDGLRAYNEVRAGCWDGRPLAILVRDPETEKVLGGLLGRTSLGLLRVDTFFLPDDLRPWRRKKGGVAAAPARYCPRSTFRHRVSI